MYNYCRTLHTKCTISVKLYVQCLRTKCTTTVKLYVQAVMALHAVVICPVCSHWCRPMDLTIPYRYVNNNYTKKHWSVFWSRCWRLNKAAMKRFLASYYKIITSKLLFVVDECNIISCQYFLLLKSIRFST